MIELNEKNYFSQEANNDYWSVSLFKAFDRCEACGLASVTGAYERKETDALLLGSYIDAYFSGPNELDKFIKVRGDSLFTKKGELYAKFSRANDMIDAIERQPLMMEYLKGEKQVIMSAELFDVPWKIKIDVHGGNRIVDLKTVKDFNDIYEPGYGWRSWVEYWGYDIQGAVYQKIEQIVNGRVNPLPFYLVAVTKETVPDVKVLQIPQHVLDAALAIVKAEIERFDMIKHGEVEPRRCEVCDYCKTTKELHEPEVFEYGEEYED